DAAIVHAGRITPIHGLSPDELETARDLIYDRRRDGQDPLLAFLARFDRQKEAATIAARKGAQDPSGSSQPDDSVEKRLERCIIDGRSAGLEALIDEALRTISPLELTNRVLLGGMRTVGALFAAGKLQLPFVLQSAETMKTAVAYLERLLPRSATAEKGVMVLATVRGDVHDIGKNLVNAILANNGFRVVDLGVKQTLERIVEAAERERADAIGLSGLLVRSTAVMREYLELLGRRGMTIPVICGGAALTRSFVDEELQSAYPTGEVFYGADAFAGLQIMEELCGHTSELPLTGPGRKRASSAGLSGTGTGTGTGTKDEVGPRRNDQFHQFRSGNGNGSGAGTDAVLPPVPVPPFWGTKIVTASELSLVEVLALVDKRALFARQWQYRRRQRNEEEHRRFLAEVVVPKFQKWCERVVEQRWLQPAVVYGYFPCNSDGNDLIVYWPDDGPDDGPDDRPVNRPAIGRERLRLSFPRQPAGNRLCIADLFRPVSSGQRDVVAFQLVTMGEAAAKAAAALHAAGQYDDYLHFSGLAAEGADALAELWHRRIRAELAISGGTRYSFGYPACPSVEDQTYIFELLEPRRIGVSLSDEYQLVPEQSTSALIAHHPQARHFGVVASARL
ncbi:MAG: vitamin B12 dependent-methionine synthase activation domain-containing protein, partial [Pseudomonadota bacterium]